MTHPTDDEIMELAGAWFHTGENQKRDDGYYYRSLGTPSNVRGSDLIEFARALLAAQPAGAMQEARKTLLIAAANFGGLAPAMRDRCIRDANALHEIYTASKAAAQPAVQQPGHTADTSKMVQQPAEDARTEPVVFMFQHSETGRITFVDAWQKENGWSAGNPRFFEVDALVPASTLAAAQALNAELLARVEVLEKDAARYQHLRKYSYIELECDSPRSDDWRPEHLDAAIDAVIAKKTKDAP